MWLLSLFAGESIGMTQVYDPYECSPYDSGMQGFGVRSPTNKIMTFGGDLLQAWVACHQIPYITSQGFATDSRKPSENMSPPKAWLWNHHFKRPPLRNTA